MYVSKPNPRSKKNKSKTHINFDKGDHYATDAKRFEYWEKFKESL